MSKTIGRVWSCSFSRCVCLNDLILNKDEQKIGGGYNLPLAEKRATPTILYLTVMLIY